jgi:Clp amino terminal domain, pathogenicity island component
VEVFAAATPSRYGRWVGVFTVGSRLRRFLLRSGSRLLRVCRTARLHRAGKERRGGGAGRSRAAHNYIGTEHILLALLELEDGTGVLAGLGVDKATAEANITRAVDTSLADHEQK